MVDGDIGADTPLKSLYPAVQVAIAARAILREQPYFMDRYSAPRDPETSRQLVRLYEACGLLGALSVLRPEAKPDFDLESDNILLLEQPHGLPAILCWDAGVNLLRGEPQQAGEKACQCIDHLWNKPKIFPLSSVAIIQDIKQCKDMRPHSAGSILSQPLLPSTYRIGEEALGWWKGHLEYCGAGDVFKRYTRLLDGQPSFKAPEILEILVQWHSDQPNSSLVEIVPRESVESQPGPASEGDSRIVASVGRFTAIGESLAERDLLGRQALVDSLAAMFADPDQSTPFTLALLGDWGAGKSSLMNLLRKKLRGASPGRFDFAWFNAWEYENTGNQAAALAQEIVTGLVEGLSWLQKARLRLRFASAEHRWKIVWASFRWLVAAIPLSIVFALTKEDNELLRSLFGLGATAGVILFLTQIAKDIQRLWEHPVAAELKTYLDLPSYGEHLGFIPVLKRHLRTLCKLQLGKQKAGGRSRLVCFVDDLDRCKPESITQTLEAIRLVIDLPDVIVLIGIDDRIALAAIASQYRDLESKDRTSAAIARDYLGKIIQLPIRLDRPGSTNLQQFVHEHLFRGVADPPLALGAKNENLQRTPSVVSTDPGAMPREAIVETSPSAAESVLSEAPPLPQRPTRSVDLTLAMQDTNEERDLFLDLAVGHCFFNPRQLTRLHNGYRLCKLIEAQRCQDKMPTELLLRLIFWQELLYQHPLAERNELRDWLCEDKNWPNELPDFEATEKVVAPLRAILGEFGNERERYDEASALTGLLVLPRGD